MTGLTALLQAAQSADAGVRQQAEAQLTQLQTQNYAELLQGLSVELADPNKPVDARRLAGLILKNTLDAKEEARKVRPGPQPRCCCRLGPAPIAGGPHPAPTAPAAAAAARLTAGGARPAVGVRGCGHEEAGQAEPAGHAGHAGAPLPGPAVGRAHGSVGNRQPAASPQPHPRRRAALGSQGDAGHTAALVIAKVAAVEVPLQQWPELIGSLLGNMAATPSTKELRQSTLEALGYCCEVGAAAGCGGLHRACLGRWTGRGRQHRRCSSGRANARPAPRPAVASFAVLAGAGQP